MSRIGLKEFGIIAVVLMFAGAFFVRAPLPEIIVAAEPIFYLAGFTVTNTFIASWLTIIVLLLLFRAATSNMQLVPRGVQNFMEMGLEALLSFVSGVAGEKYARSFFPMIATIFFFVIANSWLSLFPGFGTIGLVHHSDHNPLPFTRVGPLALIMPGAAPVTHEGETAAAGDHGDEKAGAAEAGHATDEPLVGVLVPIFRGANTDLNTTLAIALVAMAFVELWGIRANGFFGYAGKFLSVGKLARGQIGAGLIDLFVGFLETIAEIARVVSFTFRLFGNMFAGEVLLAVIVFLVPWSLVLVFYGLELFVGFVQALVFAGLTLVFASVATAGHGDEPHGAEHH